MCPMWDGWLLGQISGSRTPEARVLGDALSRGLNAEL